MNKTPVISTIFFVIMFCSLGCNSKGGNDLKLYNSGYTRGINISKKSLPENFLDHFPSKIQGSFSMKSNYPNNNAFKEYYGSTLLLQNATTQIQKFLEESGSTEYEIISAHDPRLYIIEELSIENKDKSTLCLDNAIGIPSFRNLFNPISKYEDTLSSFDFYIIESGSGKYIDDEYLDTEHYKKGVLGNGYSKGIAINQEMNFLIYWGIIY